VRKYSRQRHEVGFLATLTKRGVHMSLILDALNRARQQENAVPGLATQHPLEQLTARRRQLLLWGALAVAVVIIAWLVVDRWRAPASPGEDIGAPVAELSRNIGSAVNSVTTELKARAAAAEQAAGAVSAPGAAPVAIAPASAPQAAVQADAAAQPPVGQSAAAAAPQTAAQAAPQTIQDDAVVQLYQNRDLEEEPPVREPAPTSQRGVAQVDSELQRTSEVERILREARDEMENASLEEHSAPFLADLSQLSKDAIPTLYYQRHDYSSNASESSVTMNGSTVKAGGSVVPGMKVEEILPDSVVLNYQGTQFRLRALNSWVNL
jgi:general secretion pathway protein B